MLHGFERVRGPRRVRFGSRPPVVWNMRFRQECKRSDGGNAYKPVLFQFVPGALHFDILLSGKLSADPKRCRGASLDVLAAFGFIGLFQASAE